MKKIALVLIILLMTFQCWSQELRLAIPAGHGLDVNCLVISPNGKYCASSSSDGTIKLWEIETGREIRTFSAYLNDQGKIPEIIFSDSGNEIIAACIGEVKKWNIRSEKIVNSFQTVKDYEILSLAPCVAFSRNNKYFYQDEKLFDLSAGKLLCRIQQENWQVDACLSPDDNFLLSAGWDSTLLLLDIRRDSLFQLIQNETGKEKSTQDNRIILNETARIVHPFLGQTGRVIMCCFSPDGKFSLSGDSDGKIKLWDNDTGMLIKTFYKDNQGLTSVCFSPDGNKIASGTCDGFINVWDIESYTLIGSLRGNEEKIGALCFSADGNSIISASGPLLERWSILTKEKIKRFGSNVNDMLNPVFNIGSKGFVFTNVQGGIGSRYVQNSELFDSPELPDCLKRWDFLSGVPVKKMESDLTGHYSSYVVSPDNKYCLAFILSNDYHGYSILFDIDQGKEVLRMPWNIRLSSRELFLPDGTEIAFPGDNYEIEIWDLKQATKKYKLKGHKEDITCLSYSKDGNLMLSGSDDNTIKLWNLRNGKCLKTFKGHTKGINSVCFSPDEKSILSGSQDNSMKIWNTESGKEIKTLDAAYNANDQAVMAVCFSPDGKSAASVCIEGSIDIWDLETGKKIKSIPINSENMLDNDRLFLSYSADGECIRYTYGNFVEQFLISSGAKSFSYPCNFDNSQSNFISFSDDLKFALIDNPDKTLSLCSGAEANKYLTNHKYESLARLICIDDQDRAVISPSGLFDASEGAMRDMYFVEGVETIDLDKLKSRYYEPGLLLKLLGINKEPIRDVTSLIALDLYPEIKTYPINDALLYVDLYDRGGGIGNVDVTINRKEIDLKPENKIVSEGGNKIELTYNLKGHPYLLPGVENEIEVKAYNADNWLISRGVKEKYTPKAPERVIPPNLYAVICGASDYRGDLLDLEFASKDAADFASTLGYSANRLFGVSKTFITLLNTDGDAATYPTKPNLEKAFGDVASKAKADDIFIFYLAGHGKNWGGQDGDFYYLTIDAADGNINDPAIRSTVALSGGEITKFFKDVAALKQVLILDVCYSGKLADDLMTSREDVSSSVIRSYERMKDRTGMYILAGCAADAVSYETSLYGQGLLTYSLIFGMKGAALRDGEFVDVMKLFQHSADQVPQLAQGIGGIQRPQVRTPYGGQSFDIGRVTAEEQAKITLKTPKPMFLRSSFQDDKQMDDVLGISEAMDAKMRNLSSRVDEANVVFIDASRFSEAYKITGRYTSVGEKLNASIVLRKGDEQVTKLIVEAENTEELVRKIVEEVIKLVGQPMKKPK